MEAVDARSTRQQILKTAFGIVHREGFRGAGLNDIVRQTGLTKGAFYHHFPNKMALGYAIVDEVLEGIVRSTWLAPLAATDDPVGTLQEILLNQCDALGTEQIELGCPLNNLAIEMAPLDQGFQQRVQKVYAAWRDAIASAMRRGLAAGTVSRNVRPDDMAAFFLAALVGCQSQAKTAQDPELLASCSQQIVRYLESLKP